MPARPAKVCGYPGCQTLTQEKSGRCEAHPWIKWQRTGHEPKRLRGRAGQERRTRWLQANPLCVHCQAEGRVTAGELVDHRINLAAHGTDDAGNLQTLCKAHHDIKSAAERQQGRTAQPGGWS